MPVDNGGGDADLAYTNFHEVRYNAINLDNSEDNRWNLAVLYNNIKQHNGFSKERLNEIGHLVNVNTNMWHVLTRLKRTEEDQLFEINGMTKKLAKAEADNKKLKIQLNRTPTEENAILIEANKEVKGQNAALAKQNRELRAEMAKLRAEMAKERAKERADLTRERSIFLGPPRRAKYQLQGLQRLLSAIPEAPLTVASHDNLTGRDHQLATDLTTSMNGGKSAITKTQATKPKDDNKCYLEID